MAGIWVPRFPGEADLRIRLAGAGVAGPAADALVCDEEVNSHHETRLCKLASEVWVAACCFIVMHSVNAGKALPGPEKTNPLSRLILTSELCAPGVHHPAMAEIANRYQENEQSCNIWNNALARALQRSQLYCIFLAPYKLGVALSMSYYVPPPHTGGYAVLPACGDKILPRPFVRGLAVEALHRLTNTRRRYDLFTAELPGVQFDGNTAGWSAILDGSDADVRSGTIIVPLAGE